MNDRRATGGCMCGGVRYSVHGPLREVTNCHCVRCRKFTGHFLAASGAATSEVHFEADESLAWYSPDSTVEYGFCATCGSSLFWRIIAVPERLSIAAGAIDQPTGLTTVSAWWVAEAGDYHALPVGLENFDYEG